MVDQDDFSQNIEDSNQKLDELLGSLSRVDLDELAKKIYELLVNELTIENERAGRL